MLSHKKKKKLNLTFAESWIGLEGFMLMEIIHA